MPLIKLGVVLDPLNQLNIKKDSTIAMMEAAQKQAWQIFIMHQKDLCIENGKAYAAMQSIQINLAESPWYQLGEKTVQPLAELDIILMRKDPPFDMNYIHSTYVLELAEQEGVWVVNKPRSLRDANEKVFIAHFPECIAPTLYSIDKIKLKEFIKKHQHVAIKPLEGMGGKSVFIVREDELNLNVILEILTKNNSEMVTVQKYIPEITAGDKRILLIDAEPMPYGLARIPANDDPRGNLAAGGRGKVFKLTKRDYWLCEKIAPKLKQMGLFFVGIDVIGDYITEINVTSPTCIREIEAGSELKIAEYFIGALEGSLLSHKK